MGATSPDECYYTPLLDSMCSPVPPSIPHYYHFFVVVVVFLRYLFNVPAKRNGTCSMRAPCVYIHGVGTVLGNNLFDEKIWEEPLRCKMHWNNLADMLLSASQFKGMAAAKILNPNLGFQS
jgi:hypothetical protein